MGVNPRVALAVRSTDNYEYECRVAVLELSEDVMRRLAENDELIRHVNKQDETLREMRFGGAENVALYGVGMLNWIDCMGAWGRRWQSELVSKRITLMPMDCLHMPCQQVWEAFAELVVIWRPQQDPQFGWRFFVLEHPVEIHTTPLPLKTYQRFYNREMRIVGMEKLYEPN